MCLMYALPLAIALGPDLRLLISSGFLLMFAIRQQRLIESLSSDYKSMGKRD